MIINLVKRSGVLMPSLDADELLLDSISRGEVVQAKISRPRNGAHHRKFFAMIQIVVANSDYENSDQVLHLLKLKLGYFEQVINTNGQVTYLPRSISFAKMDQSNFNEFYNQSINIVLRDFLTDWKNSDIENAINEIIRF